MKSKLLSYLIAIAWIVLVAVLGSIFTSLGMEQFATLDKPSQWISGSVISIVWTINYLLLALVLVIAIYQDRLTTRLIVLYIANGVCNVLWCVVFFALGNIIGGQIIIIVNTVLAVLLVLDTISIAPYHRYYLSIYPLWLMIATFLNTAIWILS